MMHGVGIRHQGRVELRGDFALPPEKRPGDGNLSGIVAMIRLNSESYEPS